MAKYKVSKKSKSADLLDVSGFTKLDNIMQEALRCERDAEIIIEKAERRALPLCLRRGKLLVKAKKMVGHGDWLPTLERYGANERTAQQDMLLADNQPPSRNLGQERAPSREQKWP